MTLLSRRDLLWMLAASASAGTGFFRIGKRKERLCLIDPPGWPFFSLGLNHIDSAPLRSDETWQREFGNDTGRWLHFVQSDLLRWGFNTVGWVQEYVVINDQHRRHSRNFTPEEYRRLDLPHCHLLPFIESHQWEIETRLPKIDTKEFAEWCDYVARDQCVRYRNDTSLIGYFDSDCPVWVHTRKDNEWRGSLFDAKELKTESGRRELLRIATHYYRTLHEAIRRYDPHHLILGDRYEARAPLPEEVVRGARPYVDVLSFQCFTPPAEIESTLKRWADFSGKPILLADAAHWEKPFTPGWPPAEDRAHDSVAYSETLNRLLYIPSCVGYHLCGAYLKNNARRYGFRNARNQIERHVPEMARANRAAAARFTKETN